MSNSTQWNQGRDLEGWEVLDGHRLYHCCMQCGFTPIEGMRKYVLIHGVDAARCAICNYPLVDPVDPYEPASTDDTRTPGRGEGAAGHD